MSSIPLFQDVDSLSNRRSRGDVKRLDHGPRTGGFDFLYASPWPSPFVNRTLQEAYEETLTNKDLWIVREEERVVFETTQPFNIGIGNHGVLRDAVQDFAILVPSTNFPLALERSRFGVPEGREVG